MGNWCGIPDPPEVTSSERVVHAWPGGGATLTCIIRAEPRALVSFSQSKTKCGPQPVISQS